MKTREEIEKIKAEIQKLIENIQHELFKTSGVTYVQRKAEANGLKQAWVICNDAIKDMEDTDAE